MKGKTDAATQAHLRRLVVKALRGGMKQTVAAQQFAVSLRALIDSYKHQLSDKSKFALG